MLSFVNTTIRFIYRLIFQESIFVAICAAALAWQTDTLLDFPIRWNLYVFVGCATLAMYQVYHGVDRWTKLPDQVSVWSVFRVRIGVIILLCLATAVSWWFTSVPWEWLIVACLASMLYSIPLLHLTTPPWLHRLAALKTLLLSGIWTLVTWWFPLVDRQEAWDPAVGLLGVQRFLWMLVLCIIFDQRDLLSDRRTGRASMATVLPSWLLDAFVIVCMGVLLFLHQQLLLAGILINLYWSWQGLTIVLAGIFWYHRLRCPPTWFYLIWVDGMMLLLALISSF